MTNQRSSVVATPRSAAMRCSEWAWADVSRAVRPVMMSGANSSASTVEVASTTIDTVSTAEIDSKADSSSWVVRRWTKTGMKVADNTPPRTMS